MAVCRVALQDRRGYGLVAARPLAQGEVISTEMPLVCVQSQATQQLAPACLHCLRCCGTPCSALRRALSLVGEVDHACGCGKGNLYAGGRTCEGGCGGVFCSPACAQHCRDGAHGRLCGSPCAARLRELASTHSDAVMLAALCVAEVVLATEQEHALCAADDSRPTSEAPPPPLAELAQRQRDRLLGQLYSVPWEDIPRWSCASPGLPTHLARAARYRRVRQCVVQALSSLLREVFPAAHWAALTAPESVSEIMGMLDTSCVLPWIPRTRLNALCSDAAARRIDGHVKPAELVPCVHEAMVREAEDAEATICARQRHDKTARRAEPLWRRDVFPPIDAAALYPTLGQMNHSCAANVGYTWQDDSSTVTLTASHAIAAGALSSTLTGPSKASSTVWQ